MPSNFRLQESYPSFDMIRTVEYKITFIFSNDFGIRTNDFSCFDLVFEKNCQREKETEGMKINVARFARCGLFYEIAKVTI